MCIYLSVLSSQACTHKHHKRLAERNKYTVQFLLLCLVIQTVSANIIISRTAYLKKIRFVTYFDTLNMKCARKHVEPFPIGNCLGGEKS